MKKNLLKRIEKNIMVSLCLTFAAVISAGCDGILDEEPEPCPVGMEIRFIYDYNLERANAFPAQVECLTLHVYDSDGNYVTTVTETSSALADENYRMPVNLPEGDYRLVAYGGTACDKASFDYTAVPAAGSRIEELGMQLNPECLEVGNPKRRLHDLFYGTLDVHLTKAVQLTPVTVKMMKDTNYFRIILQHLTYVPLDGKDYTFEIIDDNTKFDYNNMLVDNGMATYTPWETGSIAVGTGEVPDENGNLRSDDNAVKEVKIAYADLSISRLMTMRSPRLVVTYMLTDTKIIDIPLNNYLLALRSNYFDWCGEQEFLDRKSEWQLFFFLDKPNHWNKAFIKIDDWTVRVNDIDAN